MDARSDPRLPLRRRREGLLMRSAELRERLRHDAEVLATPLALADEGLAAMRWLRANPEWPLAALGAWILLGPRRAARWAMRGWWLWRGARRVLAFALRPDGGLRR